MKINFATLNTGKLVAICNNKVIIATDKDDLTNQIKEKLDVEIVSLREVSKIQIDESI